MSDAPTTPDPIEMAMEAEASGVAPVGVAARVLAKQERLIGWQIASERAGFALKVLTGGAAVAAAALLIAMAWNASRADGVVIKPFAMPPELAQRGLTGEVVASELLDRLSDISEQSRSASGTAKVAADWGQNISIQIPETGVSLSQVEQWLREKLGHERRLTGEVVQAPDGKLSLVARLGGRALPAQTGQAAELPQLLVRTAEALYRRERPDTYAQYLTQAGRLDDNVALARELIESHNPVFRAEGWGQLGIVAQNSGDLAGAAPYFRTAEAENAGIAWPAMDLAVVDNAYGRAEAAVVEIRRALALNPRDPSSSPAGRAEAQQNMESILGRLTRDHAGALAARVALSRGDNLGNAGSRGSLALDVARARAEAHDGLAGRATAEAFTPQNEADAKSRLLVLAYVAAAREDWATYGPAIDAWAEAYHAPGLPNSEGMKAWGLIQLGRIDEAAARADATPLDCVMCVIARAGVTEARGQRALADHWFAEAARMAPSVPIGPIYWGRALLARGDAARAEAQFREAARRSPRAEEALEGLGEARLAQGDPAGAQKQFGAALRLTPKWGRAHLKWGEALSKLGKRSEAQAEWRTAAALDLTPAERAELQRVMR